MFHLDNNSGIDAMPIIKQTLSRLVKWFTEGDNQTPPSYPGADWFNIVQAELLNVLNEGGITPAKNELNQLSNAIIAIVNNKVKKTPEFFQSLEFESVIFSPDKKYQAVVRNDGILGFYNSKTDKLVWSVSSDGGLNDGYVNADRIPGLNDFISQTNNNVTNTNNRINETNDSLNKITDKFQSLEFESVIFSPNKQYHAAVRNDGVFGFFDRNSIHQNLSWAVDVTGGLVRGYVNVDKIRGLEDFINNFIPVGVPLPWPSTTPPSGWLICNGFGFDAKKYPKLARAYPSGRLPDMRANVIRGLDAGRGIDIDRTILSEQSDAMRNITGTFGFESNVGGNAGGADISGAFYTVSEPARRHLAASTAAGNTAIVFDASRQVPIANEFRVRSIAFLYIVRAA